MADATSNGNGAFLTITRHPDYYISGGDLSILVEHTQFRVHRYFFERESQWFATKLIQPAPPGAPPQGSSDSNSFILEDLTPSQFARFLWVFYNPRYSIYDAKLEDWEIILRLSERWSFPEVKSLSIRELETKDMTDVKRIKLYHENNVDRNILIPCYAALCEREEPLTLAEGLDLGMETTLQIASAREQARTSRLPSGARSPSTPTIRGDDLRGVIRELFKIENPPATTEETPANPGTLKPPPKQQQQQAKPPLPPQKPTERPTIQTQTPKKGKGKTAPPTTTTSTPAKETTPPLVPVKEEEIKPEAEAEVKRTTNDSSAPIPPKGDEPVPTTDSSAQRTTGADNSSSDSNDDSAIRPPLDLLSIFEPQDQTSSVAQSGSIFGGMIDFASDSGPFL